MPIRPFNPQTDMERLVALYISCFAEAPWFERFDPRELEAEFLEMLTWPDTLFLVETDEDGMIIGAAIGFHVCRKADVCELIPQRDRNSFYVAELFVDSTRRTHGVCKRLNEAMLRIAQSTGYSRVSVRTSVAQATIQHLFVARLDCTIVARQDVISTKWIDGVEQQVPDTRVLMTGAIPDYAKRDRAHEDNMYTGCMR